MAAVNRLRGDKFVMVDGTTLVTEVLLLDSEREEPCLSFNYQAMVEHQDMVVGLDITWCGRNSDDAILALCTRVGCVLTTARRFWSFQTLRQFLCNKDVIFVGVRMKEDLKRAKPRLFIPPGMKNVVDFGELASDLLHQPRLRALGVRRLASEVLSLPFESRSLNEAIVASYNLPDLKRNQIECATIDAYSAYRIGKKLLGF